MEHSDEDSKFQCLWGVLRRIKSVYTSGLLYCFCQFQHGYQIDLDSSLASSVCTDLVDYIGPRRSSSFGSSRLINARHSGVSFLSLSSLPSSLEDSQIE